MEETFNTYSPTELGKILSNLNLVGSKITKIESPSIVFDSQKTERLDKDTQKYEIAKKDVMIDQNVILTFDNGKKIGFDFPSASHVFVYSYKSDYEMDNIRYRDNKPTVADIFPEVIDKTINNFKIHSTKNIDDLGYDYQDDGFDENQEAFITGFNFILSDNSRIGFECDMDYTIFHYER